MAWARRRRTDRLNRKRYKPHAAVDDDLGERVVLSVLLLINITVVRRATEQVDLDGSTRGDASTRYHGNGTIFINFVLKKKKNQN